VTAGHIMGPGVVRYEGRGDSCLAGSSRARQPAGGSHARRAARTRCLNTRAMKDARGPQWTKVAFSTAANPLAALTGLSAGQVCTHPELRGEADRLMSEALAVCEAAGKLTRDPCEPVKEAGSRGSLLAPPVRAPGCPDRHRAEVDVSAEASRPEAAGPGFPAPGHAAMAALLHRLAESPDDPLALTRPSAPPVFRGPAASGGRM